MNREDCLAVCGDVLHEEYMKDPERFKRMGEEGLRISGEPVIRGYALYRASAVEVKKIEKKLNGKHGGGIRIYMGNSQFW
jgi:hypothetical protein